MDPQATQLSTIALFCKAAELGSFTQAAQTLGITPAAVSRGVGRLEERLKSRLFRRTTRSMQLTDDGRLYYEQCKAALAQIDDAELAITGQQREPRGLLRISVPSTYAHYRLLPRLPAFREKYPQIELEINISNRNIDFVEEGYDIAIRLGEPPDSRLVARKLEDAKVGVYASPAYLKRYGKPVVLADLKSAAHTTLPFLLPSTGRALPWIFMEDGQPAEMTFKSSVRVSEDPLGALTLARSGLGLVQTFDWIAQAHAKELTQVLEPFAGRSRPVYILYPQNRQLSARVRVLVDSLLA
ncbi:MAG: LysR family transcriptional regulator [Burkholderiales bacterium]|nr:MAG: LysR family transcriptional regulator [Burkholderiales bacterium]